MRTIENAGELLRAGELVSIKFVSWAGPTLSIGPQVYRRYTLNPRLSWWWMLVIWAALTGVAWVTMADWPLIRACLTRMVG